MKSNAPLESRADSVMDILAAQCVDLEKLLALAQRETAAASTGEFEEIVRIVAERATLGERLEIYHRQLAELRSRFGDAGDNLKSSDIARQTTQLITAIQSQDARTRPMLAAARSEIDTTLSRLSATRHGLNSYLRDSRTEAVACDQLF